MQNGRRETGCNQRPFRIGEGKTSSRSFQLIILSVFLSSCSLFKKSSKIKTDESLSKSLEAICLTAEGKGRFSYGKNKTFFSFEALRDKSQQNFQLLLEFPLYGSEHIEVIYGANPPKVDFKEGQIGKAKKRELRLIKGFILTFANFLKDLERYESGLVSQCKDKNNSKVCTFESYDRINEIAVSEDSIQYDSSVSNSNSLKILFKRPVEGYLEQIIVKPKRKLKRPYRLELFLSSCLKDEMASE